MKDIAQRLLEREVHPHFSDSIFREAAEEISRLRAALKPFADAADDLGEKRDADHLWESAAAMNLTAGDLRRASAILPQQQNTTQEKT